MSRTFTGAPAQLGALAAPRMGRSIQSASIRVAARAATFTRGPDAPRRGRHELPGRRSRRSRRRTGGPLHRRPDAACGPRSRVVAHADLLAVEEHRRAGQRESRRVDQPDARWSPPSMVGRRRRRPRPKAASSGSGPKAAKTSSRSSSVSWSRVSSSWLRTKCAHWQSSGIAGSASRASAAGRVAARQRQVHAPG